MQNLKLTSVLGGFGFLVMWLALAMLFGNGVTTSTLFVAIAGGIAFGGGFYVIGKRREQSQEY
ncbi:MAG: hypothetical protein ACFE0Q_00020 [Anaerolineae bacterium]